MERTKSTSKSTSKRALSLVLLALHLVVFSVFSPGAAFAGSGAHARATGHRALVAASSSSGGDGSVVTSSSDARLEQAARARGHRGGHVGGAPPAELALVPEVLRIPPAGLTGSLEWAAADRDHRLPPSVVNGARGPPRA